MMSEAGETCATCRYWLKWEDGVQHKDPKAPRKGSCRRGLRHVLTMLAEEGPPNDVEDGNRWVWPTHDDGDFCGEWAAKRMPLPVAEESIPVLGDTIEKRRGSFKNLLWKLIDRRIEQYQWPPKDGWLRPLEIKQGFRGRMIDHAFDFDLKGGWNGFDPPADAAESARKIQAIDLVAIATERLKNKPLGKPADYLRAFIALNSKGDQ